jgi:F-type H+-transporting ATPase subunit gamma
MTKRRDLEQHRDSLEEIGEILASMQTLAYMETRKLSRFLAAQEKVVDSIREAASDFLGFHPSLSGALQDATPVFLVVGSERGFCGDFNRALINRLEESRANDGHNHSRVVAVGHKLHSLLERDESVAALLDGASVAEEVPAVLQSVIDELNTLQTSVGEISLFGIYYDDEQIEVTALLPLAEDSAENSTTYSFPPTLNVPPERFLGDLIDHYLLATLNHMLYTSLMSENQRRVSHLAGAVRHLEQQSGELTRKCRALRQEEITEEIEVILLSRVSIDESSAPEQSD